MRPREVALLRLAAQGLLDSQERSPAEAVRAMGCLQGQDYGGVLTSIALRSAEGTRASVEASLDAGEIVRSWPMRGTLHAVAAEDLGWMLGLTAEKVLRGAARRRETLGLTLAHVERAAEVAREVLDGGRRMIRAELLEAWRTAGLPVEQRSGYHLNWYVAQIGVTAFGPTRGREQELVLLDEWVPQPRRLEGEEAVAEWARRYFTSHGPATVRDFAWWTKLTLTQARAGVAACGDALEAVDVEGTEMLMDPATPDRMAGLRSRARGVHLLPGFDEFMLGYQDRGAALPVAFAERICPGGNGMFRATLVADGQVAGVWRHTGSGARRDLGLEPFAPLAATVERAARSRYGALP